MNQRHPLFLLLWLTALPSVLFLFNPEAEARTEPETIRVVAWNIEWFPGKSPRATRSEAEAHMTLIQGELRRLNPDIFIGTEMRDWRAFAEAVAVVPGLQPVVVSAYRSMRGTGFWPMQIGIASKLPVEAAWWQRWTPGIEDNPRGFSVAVVHLGNGDGVLLVYGLHLKSNRAFNEAQTELNHLMRNHSIIQLLAHIDEMERLAYPGRVRGVIVGGDINTNHDGQFGDEVVTKMEAAGFYNTWSGVPRDRRLSWRGSEDYEPTTLDYIFTKGMGTPRAILIEVPDHASDHFPVGVQIELP